MKFDTVLLCIDESPFSLKVIEYGLELAERVQGNRGKIGVLLVVDTYEPTEGSITPAELKEQMKQAGKMFLDKALHPYMQRNIFPFVVEGSPLYEIILQTAHEFGAELLIMGSHGRTGLNRIVMGSVAEDVIRHSQLPVLVFPEKLVSVNSSGP